MLMLVLAALPFSACTSPTPDDPAETDLTAGSVAGAESEAGFVAVPALTFDMGSTPGQPDLGYGVHSVTLANAYYVGVTEVTQGQFSAIMGYNPLVFTDCVGPDPFDCPVESVSWYESAAYANAVSGAAGLQECYVCTGLGTSVYCDVGPNPYDCTGYRLLTEAEWEGAARCGTDTAYAGSHTSTDVAWTSENSGASTHTVAGLEPNGCGIYDMSGNVWEWTQDWYGEYPTGMVTDPYGTSSGPHRVNRGGGWDYGGAGAPISLRNSGYPVTSYYSIGFRVARSIPDP